MGESSATAHPHAYLRRMIVNEHVPWHRRLRRTGHEIPENAEMTAVVTSDRW